MVNIVRLLDAERMVADVAFLEAVGVQCDAACVEDRKDVRKMRRNFTSTLASPRASTTPITSSGTFSPKRLTRPASIPADARESHRRARV